MEQYFKRSKSFAVKVPSLKNGGQHSLGQENPNEIYSLKNRASGLIFYKLVTV
jgi:hypothetical protein